MARPRAAQPATLQRASQLATPYVLSGHGEFNTNRLQTANRKKLPTFLVPAGVMITFYAPDGAALENDVANLIEQGKYPKNADLQLKHNDTAKTADLPGDYPRTFTQGQEVIDYTLAPPDKLKVVASANVITVKEKASLYELVASVKLAAMKSGALVHIHWAACGAFHADDFKELFKLAGWYCRLKG